MTRNRRNQRAVLLWSLVWMISWVGVTWALKSGWLASGVPGIVAAVVSSCLGIGKALAYWRFLNEADEVQRKIELEALALAFGVGVVGGGGTAYWLLELSGAVPTARTDLLYVLAVALLTYSAGVLLGKRRYA
jgi:drug/metabolite transporter (DMT)-like permease